MQTVPGAHGAVARLAKDGTMTLALDGAAPLTAKAPGILAQMPADGLDIGTDEGGFVGPYLTSKKFDGVIESVVIEVAQ